MYLGVDIGGTKTLVAVLNEKGVIKETAKFPTPKNYDHWLLELRHTLAHLQTKEFKAAGVAVPGRLDRQHGRIIRLGNLGWENIPIQADCERMLHCPVVIENDANLGGLSEAMLHKNKETVLYVTISTGIGTGFVYKQRLEPSMIDMEGGHLLLPHKGKLTKWESFASGKAIVSRYGKQAQEIPPSDTATWGKIVRDLAPGLFQLIAITQPDLVILGGSVGQYFDRFNKHLDAQLKKYELPVVPIPPVVQAQRPDKAVVYGCYDLAKQKFGHV